MDKLLDIYKLPKLTEKEIQNLNRTVTRNEIKSVIKNLPTKKGLGTDDFTGKRYQTLKKEFTLIPLKFFPKN